MGFRTYVLTRVRINKPTFGKKRTESKKDFSVIVCTIKTFIVILQPENIIRLKVRG